MCAFDRFATDVMFQAVNGDRSNVPNYLVIMTDGNSDNSTTTWIEAMRARARGINIITVSNSVHYCSVFASSQTNIHVEWFPGVISSYRLKLLPIMYNICYCYSKRVRFSTANVWLCNFHFFAPQIRLDSRPLGAIQNVFIVLYYNILRVLRFLFLQNTFAVLWKSKLLVCRVVRIKV